MNLDDGRQNRILFLISKKDRLIRIETSKDVWDLLTNEKCSHIIKEIIAPKLKDEQYFEGIRLGLVAMINELENTGAQPAAVADR
jgi:uncharacterized membrane protein YgcG